MIEGCAPDCDERDTCEQAGEIGHQQCGHCQLHNVPVHHCGCYGTVRGTP